MSFQRFRGPLFRILLLFILGMLIFEFYVLLLMLRDRRIESDKKTLQDYENVLCGFNLLQKRPLLSTKSCPQQGIVTTFKAGELSKIMWQYANILSTSKATGLEGYVPICIKQTLELLFDNLALPDLSKIGHCDVPLPQSASSIEDWTEASQSIVFKTTDLHGKEVVKYLHIVRNHFKFNHFLSEIAQSYLLRAKGNTSNLTYVGVYITKTDIIANQEYDDIYPSVQFFLEAMSEFRREYKNVIFMVITDRERFWQSVFNPRDTFMVRDEINDVLGGPLALLSYCNHTILGMDGFPVWGAILAGGKTIVSMSLGEDYHYVMQQYDNWVHLINNTKSEIKAFSQIF